MRLKTPEQYVESLRALEIRAYAGGERLDSIVDHPVEPEALASSGTARAEPALNPPVHPSWHLVAAAVIGL